MSDWSVFWVKERESEGQPMLLVEMVRGLDGRPTAINWLQENGTEGEIYYLLRLGGEPVLTIGPRGLVKLAKNAATGRA